MINFKNMLIAMNVKANDIANGLGVDICFEGRTLAGDIYTPDPATNYIDVYLMPNDIERRSLQDGEAEVMRSGIYQATVYVGKSGNKNPSMEALTISDTIRSDFTQGLKLTKDGQSCTVFNSDLSPQLPNDTHYARAVSVYFDCIA